VPGSVSYAGWSLSWAIPALKGGGLVIRKADFNQTRVLYEGSAPFVLIDYHGGTRSDGLQLRLIRNATLRLSYAGRELLVDPSLDPAGSWPTEGRLLNPRPNPLVDLPVAADDVVDGIDGVLISHRHLDHLDRRARELIPPDTPLLHQPADRRPLEKQGFTNLTEAPPRRDLPWLGLHLTRVPGEHGFGLIKRAAGPVSGFVLRAKHEPTLYIAGDTVWCRPVERALASHQPDVIVINAGDARTAKRHRLLMNADDVDRVLTAAPQSTVVAVHLEALSHCLSTRDELRRRFEPKHGPRFLAPADGDALRMPSELGRDGYAPKVDPC
jgi:L-ascorbate metabolism protein UlaG (beta-lactamase superfamily)